ncbi:hypothetical protein B4U80_09598 [Leptotrombidium deliense]|uniref:Uncharacterized protein n=1 Tax=Leptotrombidium deliense TaxID=299467 RepID=A0A443S868_9ACAR|nr:hypothetical protein B4U80_09598 [Leptotrombidium deliense]
MDKLTLISGGLFISADIFAVLSILLPNWIVSDVGGDTRLAVVFPMGFTEQSIGGEPYQLPSSHQVGISYIFFVLSLWITVVSELFAGKLKQRILYKQQLLNEL